MDGEDVVVGLDSKGSSDDFGFRIGLCGCRRGKTSSVILSRTVRVLLELLESSCLYLICATGDLLQR